MNSEDYNVTEQSNFRDDFYQDDYVEPYSESDDEVSIAQSVVSESTVSSQKKKQRKLLEKYNTEKKGYICLYKGHGKGNRIDGYFTINTPGATIRNAVTGFYEQDFEGNTKYAVGSVWEDLFFKVQYVSTKEGTVSLFYDSPEQYTKHMRRDKDPDFIDGKSLSKWTEKNDFALSQLKKHQERNNRKSFIQVH